MLLRNRLCRLLFISTSAVQQSLQSVPDFACSCCRAHTYNRFSRRFTTTTTIYSLSLPITPNRHQTTRLPLCYHHVDPSRPQRRDYLYKIVRYSTIQTVLLLCHCGHNSARRTTWLRALQLPLSLLILLLGQIVVSHRSRLSITEPSGGNLLSYSTLPTRASRSDKHLTSPIAESRSAATLSIFLRVLALVLALVPYCYLPIPTYLSVPRGHTTLHFHAQPVLPFDIPIP